MSPREHARSLWRYTVTGGVATASHYVLTGALVEGRAWPAGLASVAGALLGAVVGYGLNRTWTFAGHATPHRQALPRFLGVAAVGALLNGALVWAGTTALGWHWFVAQAAATLTVLLAGYAANRRWTFAARG